MKPSSDQPALQAGKGLTRVTFDFTPMEAKTFDAVGSCIYCGATEQLSNEHIIPFGLGGRAVLPQASCSACASETGKVELRLLRSGNWWPLRRALDLATRHAKKQPHSFKVQVTAAGRSLVAEIPIPLHPLIVVMLEFDPPTFLSGATLPSGGEGNAVPSVCPAGTWARSSSQTASK